MKFAVNNVLSNGKARTGVLHLGNGVGHSIDTPALLLSTRKGLPHFISPDLLPSLPYPDAHFLQISPVHFFEGLAPKTVATLGGLNKMLGLPEYGFAAVARDSLHSVPEHGAANKGGASFDTRCGRLLIKPVDYVEMINSLRPNIWATLADEVPAWVSEKRNRTSVDRTVRWLDECIRLSSEGAVFGSVVGGSDIQERERCAREVATRNVSGYWIGGFGLGESTEQRPALLNAVTDILQDEKPRLICGLGLPEEVLQGVATGIDLFDSDYLYHVTLGGFGLTFPLGDVENNSSKFHPSYTASDQTKINLRAIIYRKDTTPIVENCRCYTCQNHTKAYINHLLNAHEMLAQILLEIHNTHHYLRFFKSIREAIRAGEFEQFCRRFIDRRRECERFAELAVAAVGA